MTISPIILHILLFISLYFHCSSSSFSSLKSGSSLSVEKPKDDVILSPNAVFSAGFYTVGDNAFIFSVYFTQTHTLVWTPNRDQPVNGKKSTLSLSKTGNFILYDAGQFNVWSTKTTSHSLLTTQLNLTNEGNLVLYGLHFNGSKIILWQSFDFPTDTLLPTQQLTRYTNLVSSRSNMNYSSGFYKLLFDDDNVLSLLYDGPYVSSKYWPPTYILSWTAKRMTFNSTRVALLDSLGGFISSDNFTFTASDFGIVVPRRLKLDPDGNIRVYSLHNNMWEVTWQAIPDGCKVHGICGANSICEYDPREGRRKCLCLPGHRVKNHNDWSYGCEPKFEHSCHENDSTFLKLPHVELYGYDANYEKNITYSHMEKECSQDCECKAFQCSFDSNGLFQCFNKRAMLNGRRSPSIRQTTYLKLPKHVVKNDGLFLEQEKEAAQENGNHVCLVKLEKAYTKRHVSSFVRFFLWFSVVEVLFVIFIVWCCLFRTKQKSSGNQQGYNFISPFGFKRFTYTELKQATKGFKEEIGRGSGGTVYKGVLDDQRIAAIKKLNSNMVGDKQEEAEFLAEVSIIGRLNHMNLIEMWGYCAEGKHRLLVYEFMEKGSLADNLKSNDLDWTKRYNIALGIARVLAYLHEECLEWILHCDIKPQNILLDSDYQPKVADFGMSKLLNRSEEHAKSI